MDSEIAAMIREGVAAFKAGRREEAFSILNRVTELDERNEDAWLWLSAVVQSPEDAQICLENVLAINPDNVRAQRGLAAVEKQLAEQQAAAAAVNDQTLDEDAGYAVEDGYQAAPDRYNAGGWAEGERPGAGGDQAFYGSGDVADDELEMNPGGRRSVSAGFDPFAVPQVSPLAYDALAEADDRYAADDVDDGDEYFYDDSVDDEFDTVPAEEAPAPAATRDGYRDEQRLIGYLDGLPPDIKPTHLPGKGAAYPVGLLAGVGILGLALVFGLVILVLQLL